MFYDKDIACFYNDGKKVTITKLVIPKFFELVFVQIIGTVNTLMLSGYSENAVAASGVAETLINVVMAIVQMLITGTVIVLGVELGRGNKDNAAKITGVGLTFIIISSLMIGFGVTLFAEQLMSLMSVDESINQIAVNYLRIKTVFLFVSATMNFFSSMLICNGYASFSLAVGIVSNLLNVLFGYIILYSGISFPLTGAEGIAFGGIAAQFIAMLLGICFYLAKKCSISTCFSLSEIWRILRVGVPAGMAILSFRIASFFTTSFITQLGVTAVNAKIYVYNIVLYTSLLGSAIAQANGIIIGRYRGQARYDVITRLYWSNLRLAVLLNATLSVIVLIFHRSILSLLFTSNEQIINTAWILFIIDFFVEVFRAVNNVSEHALNANGDSAICFMVSVASCWIGSIFFGYIFSVVCKLGIAGIWMAYVLDEGVKAVTYIIRWKSGKWQGRRV